MVTATYVEHHVAGMNRNLAGTFRSSLIAVINRFPDCSGTPVLLERFGLYGLLYE